MSRQWNREFAGLDSPSGFIYVLVNPSMEGLVKVGRTERDPTDRARELSGVTSIPTAFLVVYEAYFDDCHQAEQFVHARLEAKGYRVARNREFFEAPVTGVIRIIVEAEQTFGVGHQRGPFGNAEAPQLPESDGAEYSDPDDELFDEGAPYAALLDAAFSAYVGENGALQDFREALRLYKQAAKLGSISAWRSMGDIYSFAPGLESVEKALDCYKKGAARGDDQCYVGMAALFADEGQMDNAVKCWDKYFASRHFTARRTGVGECTYRYYKQVQKHKNPDLTFPALESGTTWKYVQDLDKYCQNLGRPSLPFVHRDKVVIVRDAVCAHLRGLIQVTGARDHEIARWREHLAEIEQF